MARTRPFYKNLATFSGSPILSENNLDLALEGFTYSSDTDTIKCPECLSRIPSYMDIDIYHTNIAPTCQISKKRAPFHHEEDLKEIKTTTAYMGVEKNRQKSFEFCKYEEKEILAKLGFYYQNGYLSCHACDFTTKNKRLEWIVELHSIANPSCNFRQCFLENQCNTGHCLEDASEFRRRLGTYLPWRRKNTDNLSPVSLAYSGYTYNGDNSVSCEQCNLYLVNLTYQTLNKLFTEHSQNSPDCMFIENIKGKNFYKNVIRPKKQGLLPGELLIVDKPCGHHEDKKQPDWVQSYLYKHKTFIRDLGYPPRIIHEILHNYYNKYGRVFRNVHDFTKEVQSTPILPYEGGCSCCNGSDITHAVLGCGHVCVCSSCANLIHDCPICFKPVKAIISIYLEK